jgi:putative addiction module component (TIGR02574 family)
VGVQRLIEVKIWARLGVLREAMQSIEQLTKEILSLPSVSRALLVEKLVESLEFDTDPTIQAAWVTEAKRRRDEVRNGSVTPIPGEEALAQVRQLLE